MHLLGSKSLWIIGCCLCGLASAAYGAEPTAADLEFFEKQVRPLLAAQCYKCHSVEEKQRGGLALDSLAGLITGGDNGTSLVPGQPDESRIIQAIRYDDVDLRMPPKGKLSDDDIAILTKWIELGAPWPANDKPAGARKEAEFNLAERAKFWSFLPLTNPEPPQVKQSNWPRDPLDRFILSRLEAEQLPPAAPANRPTWLRRVTFDLTGLPPTPEELAAFLADPSPDAERTVVDRLLASEHYGERWARHWLDLARYAETSGHEFDFEIPYAFEYRDYLIRAFNQDLPYDQFVIEQIAGDLLPEPRRHPTVKFNESIIGTGFWWLGEGKHSPVDIRAEEMGRIDNQLDVFGKTFLGLTIGCARCHDHKFDAISAKDYYALAGYIRSSHFQHAFIDDPAPWEARLAALHTAQQRYSAVRGGLLATAQQPALEQFAALLLASREVPDLNDGAALEAAAREHGVAPQLLKELLAELARATEPTHPLFVWKELLRVPATDFVAQRKALAQRIAERATAAQKPAGGAYDLASFSDADFGAGWRVTGQAFGAGPITAPHAAALAHFDQPTTQAGIAHSGSLSPRLRGVLRSPDFPLDRRRVWVRTAGKDTRIRLVIDEFHFIQNPIYGGLQIGAGKPEQPGWQEFHVEMWQGHRAYLEFIDENDGWIAVDRVALSDGGPPPDAPHPFVVATVGMSSADTPAALAQWLQQQFKLAASQSTDSAAAETPGSWELTAWLARVAWLGTPEQGLAVATSEMKSALSAAQATFSELEAQLPVPRRALALQDGTPADEQLLIRGSHKTPGETVPRRFLEAFQGTTPGTATSGRLELARELVDPQKNPLVARVIVNRLWQHHFGSGLVRSPDDFGKMGQLPTHPELLDYLAQEFIRSGWSFKAMHRRMLLSATYGMSSAIDPEIESRDPTNQYWHRMPVQRLEAESIRDAMLAVSGRLNPQVYGPSVLPYLTPFMQGRGRPASGPLDGDGRRSLYINVRRNFLSPMFLAFDFPIPFNTIGRRGASNVPAQALSLMNNQFVLQQAYLWGEKLHQKPNETTTDKVRSMYLAAYARLPEPSELEQATQFIEQQAKLYGPQEQAKAWGDLAHVLFNVKEFIFLR